MPNDGSNKPGGDPMIGFWNDWFARMGMGAMPQSAPSPPAAVQASWSAEVSKQMQRAFLDAMAKYCEEYMRSEQFLGMMKQTLDRSMAFKQQLDQFMAQAVKGMQVPARGDVDDLAGTLRGIEDRVLKRLETLENKIESLEGSRPAKDAGKQKR